MAYSDSLDVDQVLLKWLNVLEKFCQCHNRLNHNIESITSVTSRQSAQRTAKLGKLLLLREQVSHTMATLLIDMSPRPAHSNHMPFPPTYTKLQVHIRLLEELTRKIDAELTAPALVTQA